MNLFPHGYHECLDLEIILYYKIIEYILQQLVKFEKPNHEEWKT